MRRFLAIASLGCVLLGSAGYARGGASEWSGLWRGSIPGEDELIEALFTSEGDPVFAYENHNGSTGRVPLTTQGEAVVYAPPGGGLQRVVVKALDRSPDRVVLSLHGIFERTDRVAPDHLEAVMTFDYRLVPEGLRARISHQATSDSDSPQKTINGGGKASIVEVLLQRVE